MSNDYGKDSNYDRGYITGHDDGYNSRNFDHGGAKSRTWIKGYLDGRRDGAQAWKEDNEE